MTDYDPLHVCHACDSGNPEKAGGPVPSQGPFSYWAYDAVATFGAAAVAAMEKS